MPGGSPIAPVTGSAPHPSGSRTALRILPGDGGDERRELDGRGGWAHFRFRPAHRPAALGVGGGRAGGRGPAGLVRRHETVGDTDVRRWNGKPDGWTGQGCWA